MKTIAEGGMVLSNVLHRKTRTILSVTGVALGVVLVVLTAGLVNGFLHKQGDRNAAVAAEIQVRPAGGAFGLGFEVTADSTMPVNASDQIRAIDGVAEAVPIAQFFQGQHLLDGIEYESFKRISDARVIEGRAPASGDEVMVDTTLRASWKLQVGDDVELLNRPFRVVGFYSPESLARFKIPLATLQSSLAKAGLCSLILVKVKDPADQAAVATRIKESNADYQVVLTRDIPILYQRGTPALQTFLKVVIALATFVSSLVILLSMYTTINERTRQIGILKSLGASRAWIAGEIEKESLLLSLLGIACGFAVSWVAHLLIERLTPLHVDLEPRWFIYSFVLTLISGVAGALYPAWRAATQDPVKALSYE
jgi:putative ABC transport system permease protein